LSILSIASKRLMLEEVGGYLTRCARIAALIPLIWPTVSHSLSYSVSYLYRYRAARAKQIKLKKANVNSKQRESKIILNSKRHDKIREIFSLSSQKYLFHIHFTPPLCRFPTILWQSSSKQWKNWVFLKLDENDSFLM